MAQALVFLLGAGASKDAGLPLMADLTTGFLPWLTGQKRPDDHLLRQLFEAAVRVVYRGTSPPNIELVLQLLGDINSFKVGAHAQTVVGWKAPFDAPPDLVTSLSGLIREYIRETLSRAPASSGDYLSGLLDFRAEQTVDVFTLNYDRLVESMAARSERRFTSGFGEAWDPSLFELENWDLRLYKLHGSVDWYRLTSRNVIYRGSPEHPAFPGEAAQEVLLYPARGKAANADPFATLMSLFNRALANAEFCIAIGYSFRDQHIRRAVLDRMLTNRSLQLLVVNTSPEDVMTLGPEDPDEPQFAQFLDRVAGLRMGAKDAFENRAIVQRLGEIHSADSQLSEVARYRNHGAFDQAAGQLYGAIEYCRQRQLQYKPVGYLGRQGAEFDRAFVGVIVKQFPGQKLSGTGFETSQTENLVLALGRIVALWALAAALVPGEAAVMREEVGNVMKQYASNVMFSLDGEYHIWTGGLYMEDKALIEKRGADLTALSRELVVHRPETALVGASDSIKADYEVLRTGVDILAGYYRTLAQNPLIRKQVAGHEIIISGVPTWQALVGEVSGRFLRSKMPEAWLPAPDLRGRES